MVGTTITARVERVVDGDTIRVLLPGAETGESLRLLCLDTEETHPGAKPVTPLGRRASARAADLVAPGDEIRVMLPGSDPVDEALRKYRGNYGRLLCYVTLPDGRDFQEVMIREGLSPYFQKYGYAHFAALHDRYTAAERAAQSEGLGVWDQVANNGQVMRDYTALGTWWDLRARIIAGYRDIKRRDPQADLYNSRLDYDRLLERARSGREATVFMELRDYSPVGGDHILFLTGSRAQPFQLFVPGGNDGRGSEIMRLLLTRYVAGGEAEPRRSYAYVTGSLSIYPPGDGAPQIVVTRTDQVTDQPPGSIEGTVATDPAGGTTG